MDALLEVMGPEAAVLLRVAGGPQCDASIRELAAQGTKWPTVIALADRERVTSVVWRRLDRLGIAEGARALRPLGMVTEFAMGQLEQRLEAVVDLLSARAIPFVLLKGAAIAIVYGARFFERPMGDLDILVSPDDRARVIALLCEHGWRRHPAIEPGANYAHHHHGVPLIDEATSGAVLEVHSDVLVPGHPFALTTGDVWRRSRRVAWHGREVGVPCDEDLMLHCCIHFAWANVLVRSAWRAMRDVHLMSESPGVDWERNVEAASSARAATCMYWTLCLARTVVGAAVPADVLARLRNPAMSAGLERRLLRHFLMNIARPDACPSVRLSNLMWTAAIRPGASRHGSSRPWLGDDPLHPRIEVPRRSPWARVVLFGGQVRATSRYVWSTRGQVG